MRIIFTSVCLIVLLMIFSLTTEVAFKPIITLNQLELVQGDLLVIQVENLPNKPEGTFLGQDLDFLSHGEGWMALVGTSYWTKPGNYLLSIQLAPTQKIERSLEVKSGDFSKSYLTVSEKQQRIVKPTEADQKIIERKAADQKLLAAAYSQGASSPLWTEPFIVPTEGRITTGYGATRYVNGKINNRHSGLDLANTLGTPIYAVNNGIVRLTAELLVTGKTIVIDHGAGLYSCYYHQSEILVEPDEEVEKGQLIGKMGSTGFSTGSHLHWKMMYKNLNLNPSNFIDTNLFQGVVIP